MRGPPRVNIFLSRPCPQWSSPTSGRRLRALLLRKGFCFSPPIRPASIRTLSGAVGSGASWSPQSQIGCCHLGTELSCPVSGDARSAATSQSPELGDGLPNELHSFRPPASKTAPLGCCAMARILLRLPTAGAATPPASAPPPQSRASSHSCRHVQPASAPTVSNPYPDRAGSESNVHPAPATSANTGRLPW